MPLLGLVGVWFILIGRLSLATRVPAIPEFGWMSVLTGVAFLVFLLWSVIYNTIAFVNGTVSPAVASAIGLLMTMTALTWSLFHLAWTILATVWLLQRRAYPPAQVA